MFDMTIEGYSRFTSFFSSHEKSNLLKINSQGKTVLAFSLSEEQNKTNVYIQLPSLFHCYHFFDGKITSENVSTDNTHLTYHGTQKKLKQSGETHLMVDGQRSLKDRSHILEAPLAVSKILTKYPLPLCRFEFTKTMETIVTEKDIHNEMEIFSDSIYKNTIDVYLTKRDFMHRSIIGDSSVNEIFHSLFNHYTVEGIIKDELILRRSDNLPQIAVLQSSNFELILFNIQEAQHLEYSENKLIYFHSLDYFRRLCKRNVVPAGDGGWFVSKYPMNKKQEKDDTFLNEL